MNWSKEPDPSGQVTPQNFYRRAHWWATKIKQIASDQWPVIRPGTPEWEAWASYFRGMGWVAAAFQSCLDKAARGLDAAFTVPTHKPGEFDAYGWAHRRDAPPKVLKQYLSKPTMEELRKKYGPDWGINAHDPSARYPQFARMTKEQALARLRAEFGEAVDAVPDAPLGEWRKL